MKPTETALRWIINLLENKNIQYRITGGLAAQVYGSNRPLADIDIEVDFGDVELLNSDISPFIIFGPSIYKDENWDLNLVTLNYEGQEIDLADFKASIFNRHTKQWESLNSNLSEYIESEIYGRKYKFEPIESLLEYKDKLGREVDLEDIRQIKKR